MMEAVDIHMPRRLFIQYGDHRIYFERVSRTGNSSKVQIKVRPDQRVVAHAPEGESDETVLKAVKKRARWISNQLKEFAEQHEHVTPRKYVSGESHYYLGKQYILKVLVDPKAKQQVKLLRGKLEVTVRQQAPEKVRGLLNSWYREKAREVFQRRLEALLSQTLWVKDMPPTRLLAMKTQWGSCSPHGTLTLNPHLVKAPRQCIDYVLLHELCHIAEHNHSERFYRLMVQVMPEWGQVKERLDRMVGRILTIEA
ncbi:MAG: SprT family zinc-dependent metalloprotease [Pseudomonadota bacterium]